MLKKATKLSQESMNFSTFILRASFKYGNVLSADNDKILNKASRAKNRA
jgi:hypothetical protein